MDKEILESLKRQEALLRSILGHVAAFNQTAPLLFKLDQEQAGRYIATYQEVLQEAIDFYLHQDVFAVHKKE